MLRLYGEVAKLALKRAAQSWLAALSIPIYALLFMPLPLVGPLVAPLGMLGGMVIALFGAACFGGYLSLLALAVAGSKIRLVDMKNGLRAVWDVTSVFFIIWIIDMVLWLVVKAAGPKGPAVMGVASLAMAIFFNLIPELICHSRNRGAALLQESAEFVVANPFAWFAPNLRVRRRGAVGDGRAVADVPRREPHDARRHSARASACCRSSRARAGRRRCSSCSFTTHGVPRPPVPRAVVGQHADARLPPQHELSGHARLPAHAPAGGARRRPAAQGHAGAAHRRARRGRPPRGQDFEGTITDRRLLRDVVPHCRQALPDYDRLKADFGDRVRLVIVDVDEDPATVRAFFARGRLPAGAELALDRSGATARAWGVTGYPTVYLLDRRGIVRDSWSGWGEDSRRYLSEMIPFLENEETRQRSARGGKRGRPVADRSKRALSPEDERARALGVEVLH